ncbi:hypothetical protein N7475_003425 [Penicillium sp. IBT 31633x]|nr:hypothetical protein N7475_003425 [Penicillium sp. IBT 31633x]
MYGPDMGTNAVEHAFRQIRKQAEELAVQHPETHKEAKDYLDAEVEVFKQEILRKAGVQTTSVPAGSQSTAVPRRSLVTGRPLAPANPNAPRHSSEAGRTWSVTRPLAETAGQPGAVFDNQFSFLFTDSPPSSPIIDQPSSIAGHNSPASRTDFVGQIFDSFPDFVGQIFDSCPVAGYCNPPGRIDAQAFESSSVPGHTNYPARPGFDAQTFEPCVLAGYDNPPVEPGFAAQTSDSSYVGCTNIPGRPDLVVQTFDASCVVGCTSPPSQFYFAGPNFKSSFVPVDANSSGQFDYAAQTFGPM